MIATEGKAGVYLAGPQCCGLCDVARHDTTDVAVLDETDRACLDELGHYLASTDAWRRFAIWLLHKHFEPAAGEIFAERVIAAPRGTQITLVERCSAPDLTATSLRFDPGVSSGVGVIGLEFADPADFGPTASGRGR
jgi:hypothetical protein